MQHGGPGDGEQTICAVLGVWKGRGEEQRRSGHTRDERQLSGDELLGIFWPRTRTFFGWVCYDRGLMLDLYSAFGVLYLDL